MQTINRPSFSALAAAAAHGGRIIAARKAAAPAAERMTDSRTGSSESRRWKALPSEQASDKQAAEVVQALRVLSAAGFPILAMAEATVEAAPAKKSA